MSICPECQEQGGHDPRCTVPLREEVAHLKDELRKLRKRVRRLDRRVFPVEDVAVKLDPEPMSKSA
jgi:hypothetical protein